MSMVSMCCANCFRHSWLIDLVRGQGIKRGTCWFCGAHQVRMIQVQDLAEPFNNLLAEYVHESYRADELSPPAHHWAAAQLSEAFQQDWGVFSPAIVARNNADILLKEILAITKNRLGESLKPNSWVLRFSTQSMRSEWRFWSRMFSEGSLLPPKLLDTVREEAELLGTLENQVGNHLSYFAILLDEGTVLFRARSGCQPLPDAYAPHRDLGPNPAHPASRANSDGQYAMYLSESEATAVAEIKPSVGSRLSVGEFTLSRDLTVVDLCQSLAKPNPFTTKNLPWILDLTYLLSGIARTMSRPAQAPDDYITTQLLSNIARAIGYDGIRFPSALNPMERNVVLFKRDGVRLRASWVNLLNDIGFRRL